VTTLSNSTLPSRRSNGTVSPDASETAILDVLSQTNDKYDEDCLTINVWTKPQAGERAKAVMVWIPGEGTSFPILQYLLGLNIPTGFMSGSSSNPAYNGARLAEENDVVVVSLKYLEIRIMR
jgi:cholinesterase